MATLAIGLGLLNQGSVVPPATGGLLRCRLKDGVGIFPVEPVEAHLAADFGEDLPIGPGLAWWIEELLVEAEPTLGVVAGEILLAPGGGGMPAFGAKLDLAEIEAVARFEREQLGR